MAHSLSGGLKHLLLVGIGATATSIDKAEALIDDLTRKGEITVEQGRILNEELKHRSDEAKRQATEKVDHPQEEPSELKQALDKVLNQIDELDEADRKRLTDRLRPAAQEPSGEASEAEADRAGDQSESER